MELWGKRYVVKHHTHVDKYKDAFTKPEPLMRKIDNGDSGTLQIYIFRVIYYNFDAKKWVQKDYNNAFQAQVELKKAWRQYYAN